MAWFFILLFCVATVSGQIPFTNGTRVVLLGDSYSMPKISGGQTSPAGEFQDFLASWYIMRNPAVTNAWFWNESRSGLQLYSTSESSNGQLHYDKWVKPMEPTVVLTLLTENGGETTNDFATNLVYMVTNKIVGFSGAQPILGGVVGNWDTANGQTNKNLPRSDIHEGVGVANGWTNFNIWRLTAPRASNVWALGSNLGQWTNAHPGPSSAAAIAAVIVNALGEDGLVSTATINASTGQASATTNCTISNVVSTARSLAFTRLDTKLPMAIDERSTNLIPHFSEILDMNRYMLVVTGLSAGTYRIFIEGTNVATLTHSDLSAGWNMSTTTNGWVWEKRRNVLRQLKTAYGIDADTFLQLGTLQGYLKFQGIAESAYQAGNRDQDLINACTNSVQVDLKGQYELVRQAAQPEALDFLVVQVVATEILGAVTITGNSTF